MIFIIVVQSIDICIDLKNFRKSLYELFKFIIVRGNCSCSAAISPPSKVPESHPERLMFQFDDISENRKAAENEVVSSTSSDPSATQLSTLISQTSSEVFPQDSPCLCLSESVGTQIDSKRSSRSSCKSHAEAISIIVPNCKQRHTNFTPPRSSLSEKALHVPEGLQWI